VLHRLHLLALPVLVFTLAGCPGGYYEGGGGGGGAGPSCPAGEMHLVVEVANQTGYSFTHLGLGIDMPEFLFVPSLNNAVPDGDSYVSDACYYDYALGTDLLLYVEALDSDGDCYDPAPNGIPFTAAAEVPIDVTVTTSDLYGDCP
jgi:hypothetical protein